MMKRIVLAALLLPAHSRADTLKLDPYFDGEHRADNKIWAAASDGCTSYPGVCADGKYRQSPKTPAGLAGKPCKSCPVKYLRAERSGLKLTWDAKAGKWLGADRKPFDTDAAAARQKRPAKSSRFDGVAAQRWKKSPAIWVLDPQGSFYVTAEQDVGKFHHSSIMGGGLVEGAGQVVIEAGTITRINNQSGHYKPDDTSFVHALTRLHVPKGATIEYCQNGKDECQNTPMARGSGPTLARKAAEMPAHAASLYGAYN